MATVANTLRCAARSSARNAASRTTRRAFTVTTRDRAASNFTMPALSPTMTEGNIAQWRIKEGDSYSAGDVLLAIETDKATMDVEAQDDGVLVKIFAGDDSKAVAVGSRIAVIGESGDDPKSLEIPEDDTPQGQPAADVSKEKKTMTGKDEKTNEEAKAQSKSNTQSTKDTTAQSESSAASSGQQKQKYPFYPSVQHLLHQNGLSDAQANEIPASGPHGRLLKGDVLAYLGQINKDYPKEAAARLMKLSHLDLSNIQLAELPKKSAQEPTSVAAEEPQIPQETELALPISLQAVLDTQKRMQTALHTSLPLSVFIARASELANESLPLPAHVKPTRQELFNAVLGLPHAKRTHSRGRFVPALSTLDLAATQKPARRKDDIIDFLAGGRTSRTKAPSNLGMPGSAATENLFSVMAKSGEEERAMIYLERMKYALEKDPGRLVL